MQHTVVVCRAATAVVVVICVSGTAGSSRRGEAHQSASIVVHYRRATSIVIVIGDAARVAIVVCYCGDTSTHCLSDAPLAQLLSEHPQWCLISEALFLHHSPVQGVSL